MHRILPLAGWRVTTGRPGDREAIGVWGRSPHAKRGEAVAARTGAPIVRIEDTFLRSLMPSRSGEPPLGLLIVRVGVRFDSNRPSALERLLATCNGAAVLDRAQHLVTRLRRAHLTKYSAVDPSLPVPDPGYVLLIDQTRGDASNRHSGATEASFAEMLTLARLDHPGARVVIQAHPETAQGYRHGHFGPGDLEARTKFLWIGRSRPRACWTARWPSMPSTPNWGSRRSLLGLVRGSWDNLSMPAGA